MVGGWDQFTEYQRQYAVNQMMEYLNKVCGEPLHEDEKIVVYSGNSVAVYIEKVPSDSWPHWLEAKVKIENSIIREVIGGKLNEIVVKARSLPREPI